MNLFESMSLLVAVVDAGSFSSAARHLGVPLPTVSRKVADLESYLKTRLLHRTTRTLSLTEAGVSYVDACRRILEQVGEAQRTAIGEHVSPRGDLVITAPVNFGRLHVVPVVAEFLVEYPEININLVLTDRVVHLMDEHADVAIRIGELPDSTLIATRLGSVRRVVCGSPSYLQAHGVPGTPRILPATNASRSTCWHPCRPGHSAPERQKFRFPCGRGFRSTLRKRRLRPRR